MLYYLKKNWKISSFVCFFQIAQWGLQALAQILLMKDFEAAMNLDFSAFLYWNIIALIVWGTYFIVCSIQACLQSKAVKTLNNQVRHDLYLSILGKKQQEYHQKDSGEYISWMTNDIKQIENLSWNPFFDCVGRISQVLWSVFVLFQIHWSLMVLSLLSAAIMWSLPKLFEKRLEQAGTDCSEKQAEAVGQLKDLLSGLDVLRCFHRTDRFIKQGDEVSEKMEHPFYKLFCAKSVSGCFMGYISVSLQIIVGIFVIFLSVQGILSPSVLAGAGNLVAGVTNGLNQISNLRLSIAAGKPYFHKIAVQKKEAVSASESLVSLRQSIQTEHLSFSYQEKPILKDLNCTFEIGKKYAITGPSGCGKSTLLKILLGWLPEYSGKVLLDGKDAKNFTAEQLQQQMGYIEQNVFLFNTTIRENITLGEDFSNEQLQKALHDSALIQDLQSMPEGLDTVVGEEGRNLSGGQKQRVAIARVLIHNRSILLVDEGTSALDKKNADIVENSLLANPDLTLILISHHLTEERKAQFDRVYALSPAELSNNL